MAVTIAAVTNYQNWPASVFVLLVVGLATLIARATWRPALPKAAPKLIREGYPVLGMLRFFSDRRRFIMDGMRSSKTGNFSFFFGKHPIVNAAGIEGRKVFFESKALNMSEGYAVLFTTTPKVEGQTGDGAAEGENANFSKWFSRTIIAMMRKENFVRNLPLLVGDTRARFDSILTRPGGATTGILDPFNDLYRIVYQLTMRTVGATEIADSPELLEKTLGLFEKIEQANSPTRIIFPWIPTPAHLKRMAAGARLYMIFNKIAEDRKQSGRREEDAFQFLLDSGDPMVKILAFVLGALFAGQLNSGINAAWMFVYLAADPYWYGEVRNEVDAALARHRTSPSQSPADILSQLTIEEWESEFPLIDLCLRECIRHQLVGTAFRRNTSGQEVRLGATGEVVPRNAFAVYLLDDIHMDPAIYTDPGRWDPGRYLPDRAEDKKAPHAYLGWGVGRHPCLGMRFAKLEMGIIGALFVAMFDYELVDVKGNKMPAAPQTNRDNHAASKPDIPVRLRYTVRQH